ncbi:class I adenylate-forming enzyme family protein [Streptomyces sp. NPDC018352]|uniref:class I adenylate-forming enzyme family protein n=1 Tax=Streptomyces sp. NPDC018352 TaxID=3157194 RepID=UPI003401A0ED
MPTFVYPRIRLDGLLRQAAVRDPAGCALRTAAGPVTFAELDDRADRIAAYLEHTLGRRGARVGVANTLDAVFPAAYYGTARSGNTVVLVNPLLRAEGLEHVLASAAVEVAFVPTATAELLVKLADRLPALRTVVVTDASEGIVPSDAVPLRAALDSVPGRRPLPALATDLDADVCVQFTTGTTGRPKGVRLSHRNLVANAAQTAAAHHLGSDSVTLNHLPLYHVMHLNSAMYAGAEQVLCADPDPWASLRYAAEAGATHYYGLPARLHRLAGDERLLADGGGAPGGARLTVVLSGGTALAPPAVRVLSEHIGVPVVQGYGMAELSPLSHCQSPYGPGAAGAGGAGGVVGGVGGVGGVVPGTECRIVHLDTRQVLDAHATGEVQVRGPQVMAGYLDDPGPAAVDADGWFSTGDVGHLDEDGQLFLVDRLGDVFKHDNELVSPSAVEAVLGEDPRVTDCIAAGWPDDIHGAVVWTGIVLRDPAAPGLPEVVDAIVARANERLAPYERIRRAEVLDAVPRTPVGKPERRVLRQQLSTRAAEEAAV